MKNKWIVFNFSLMLLLPLYTISCASDKLPEPMAGEECDNFEATYDGDIKQIIETSCALSGCHVVGGGTPGVFTSYAGLSDFANDAPNGLRDRVIVLKNDPTLGMPPDGEAGPDNLTEEQFKIFKCWVDSGYPEN